MIRPADSAPVADLHGLMAASSVVVRTPQRSQAAFDRCVVIQRPIIPVSPQVFPRGLTSEITTTAAPPTTAARDYTVY